MIITLVRTLILYGLIVLFMRLMGKRQLSQLEPSELVVSIMISDLAAVPMQNPGVPLISGVIPIITLYCVEMLLSILCKKSMAIRKLLCGHPSIIISDGVINQDELKKLRISITELLEELRLKDVFDISEVSLGCLETNGQLSVLLKPEARTVTASDMNIETDGKATSYITVVACGKLIKENLYACGHNEAWLEMILKKEGLSSYRDVFLLIVDDVGNTVLIPKSHDRKPTKKDV